MTPAATLGVVAAVDFLAGVSPGPNFLLISQTAMRRGRSEAFWTVLGVSTSSLIWVSMVVLGLAAVFRILPRLHE